MTKVVFIASALFLLSVVFKSNLERPREAVQAQVAASDSWSDKLAGLATGLNELLASEPIGAGQTENADLKSGQAIVTVSEELVDPAKYDAAFAKSDRAKLASVLPPNTSGINPAVQPSATEPMTGLPTSTVPFASNSAGTRTSDTRARSATVPLVSNSLVGKSSEDAIPKVTEQAGKFYVQYGIFSSACRSERVKEKLAQAGIYSVMDKLDPEGVQWIVKSKAYASRAEVIYNLQTAQRKGYESYLVTAN